jgi:hypothetical protein
MFAAYRQCGRSSFNAAIHEAQLMSADHSPKPELDHLVIAAKSLDEGARYVRDRLGVEIPAGGRHPLMGTHNRLMRLGASAFLEVIAIDPDAERPDRPRWYALDDPLIQKQLSEGPKLVAWVMRSNNIDHDAIVAGYSSEDVIPVSRGTLSWRLTVPPEGSLPRGGAFPHLIQWDDNARPWTEMTDKGVGLVRLHIMHPEAGRLASDLSGLIGEVPRYMTISEAEKPKLAAELSVAGRKLSI